ncbi:MAG: hypothetical protein CMJ65_08080 [Planctomycetaceae bacterium]|jgi:uncharacterized protein (DUF1501 family)|nr:hypothetical protein [Planctomycetaceae bacterium]
MLSIQGSGHQFCDGVSRRSFLQIGGLGLGGLTLADLMRAQSQATGGADGDTKKKAVIMIYLAGGVSHQDWVDLKPDAPSAVRGEFNPIATNVPGIEICELAPRMAKMMDKFAIIRSIVDSDGAHAATQCWSGVRRGDQARMQQPSFGSFLARELGSRDSTVPAYMGLTKTCGHKPWCDVGFAGKLGRAYAPAKPDGEDVKVMKLNGVTLDQFNNRKKLLEAFDGFRRQADSAVVNGANAIYEQAFEVLTSSKLLNALDVSKEDPAIRERYGKGSSKNVNDGPPVWNEQVLICRRLIEAGVRCVTLGYGRWDYHGNNFGQMKQRLPMLDQCLSALVTDLHERGMDKDVTVLVCTEFGRTPKINKNSGRDHWPPASCAVLAGGGLRTGQVIGSTTKDAGHPKQRPVRYQEIMATLYHNMGINPKGFIRDSANLPIKLLNQNPDPLHELI